MSISIVGAGMGTGGTLTTDAQRAISRAGVVIGGSRLLEGLPADCTARRFSAVAADDILEIIKQFTHENICVLMSGDVGFYSGAAKLLEALPGRAVNLIPGVSSVQYFAAKLARPWQDWKLVSAHGKSCDAVGFVKGNRETFFLTGGALTADIICRQLTEAGFGHLAVTVGEYLGSANERMASGTAEELSRNAAGALTVMLVENPRPRRSAAFGFDDAEFLRGDIPMTKSEVRSVILSKMRLCDDYVVYDVGAGTGSVSVEAALLAGRGHVYAFEREAEGCRLIAENARRFGAVNLTALQGEAPGTFQGLPCPDAAFIGGSGGKLLGIMETLLRANPSVRLVASAVALETVGEATAAFNQLPLCDVEVTQISVSRSKLLGQHHLMLAQNPIFIFSGTGVVKP